MKGKHAPGAQARAALSTAEERTRLAELEAARARRDRETAARELATFREWAHQQIAELTAARDAAASPELAACGAALRATRERLVATEADLAAMQAKQDRLFHRQMDIEMAAGRTATEAITEVLAPVIGSATRLESLYCVEGSGPDVNRAVSLARREVKSGNPRDGGEGIAESARSLAEVRAGVLHAARMFGVPTRDPERPVEP